MSRLMQCATCGVERAGELPELCPICADERQYVPASGQRWLEPGSQPDAALQFTEAESGVHALAPTNVPGIGQHPLLVASAAGNIMIEAPAHIDVDSIAAVRERGGLAGLIATHPHMYGLQSLWAREFDCPVYIAKADAHWLGARPDHTVVWEGELALADDLHASQPGGHFPGSTVVHWRAPDGSGVLFAGDTIGTARAPGWVTFMRSFPNYLPLSAAVVARIAEHVARYDFERLYGNFGARVDEDAAGAVARSAARHIDWVSGRMDHLT
ncbi:MBL fold metallo-hydrolase [Gulosibacter macacae]|uniref:MBL fold metallo-hydrolase n=1 Tax=Gulosibacter macacae TaxID=2488791 RepID=A0A3P3W128_9MICO|nr:MBL fold metallo-hydrolase [Gulosibacter macacae]RRJ86583.1 MBL fold metallo-hydrolase [Gulosibacter macacae]